MFSYRVVTYNYSVCVCCNGIPHSSHLLMLMMQTVRPVMVQLGWFVKLNQPQIHVII